LSDFDLNEWLRYFVDGENCFQNISYKNRPFTFRFVFKIKLHRDDRPLLEYLSTRFNIGQVYPKEIDSDNISNIWEVSLKKKLLLCC
jgi:LAGLIDADG DNA endonuclease family protein